LILRHFGDVRISAAEGKTEEAEKENFAPDS
jgi:hypothetical protein